MGAIAVVSVVAVGSAGTAHAQDGGDDAYPPEPEIDVTGFSGVCEDGVPKIHWNIQTTGFAWPGQATVQIYDVNDEPRKRDGSQGVDVFVLNSQAGSMIYPGASSETVDGQEVATDWPGWSQDADGSWFEEDPNDPNSDHIVRQGLRFEVTVNPTASAMVDYPDASPVCAQPPETNPPPPNETTTTVVEAQAVAQPRPQGQPLPPTGGGGSTALQLAAVAVAGGALLLIASRRRRFATV